MPGYNHFPWCLCGWCFNQGRNGYSSEKIENFFDKWSAERFLRAEGATRSFTACFVQPNATCPVCGERVFFYANKYGSRVFFDELGWPWPKHACTDRRAVRTPAPQIVFSQPVVRAKGMRIEIADAVKRAAFSPLGNFDLSYKSSPPPLFRVIAVVRIGFRNLLMAVAITPESDDQFYLEFTSAKLAPETEAFFSLKDGRVWLLDGEMVSQSYQAKEITRELYETLTSGLRV